MLLSDTAEEDNKSLLSVSHRGRKGLVDIVHIPKDSLPLIQTCIRGQEAVGVKCMAD